MFNIIFNYKHYKNYKIARKLSKKINKNCFSYNSSILVYLRKINPFVFEELLLYTFKKRGYKIYRNKRYTGDGGIDGKVKINKQIFLIQAKRYSSYINMKHLIDFNILCKENNTNGFFIHTGKTGSESKKINSNIKIISGDNLIRFLKYEEYE